MRPVCVIVNPAARGGRGPRGLPAVLAALAAADRPARTCPTRDLDHARALARAAAGRGEIAAALGGDGLVGAVGGALAGSDGVLAVLPGGRGNDLARALGVPLDPRGACAVLLADRVRRVDVGDVDGRPFLGVASAGLDTRVAELAAATRLRLGRLVYAWAALRALRRWGPVEWTVELDGASVAFRGLSVAVANSGVYGGGMRIAPAARMDDGRLDAVLVGVASRRRAVATLPRVFAGRHVASGAVRVVGARTVRVAAPSGPPLRLSADGELLGALPARIGIRPGALRVLAPGGAAT